MLIACILGSGPGQAASCKQHAARTQHAIGHGTSLDCALGPSLRRKVNWFPGSVDLGM